MGLENSLNRQSKAGTEVSKGLSPGEERRGGREHKRLTVVREKRREAAVCVMINDQNHSSLAMKKDKVNHTFHTSLWTN